MNKTKFLFLLTLLGTVVLFSLGNTLSYYFYTDDYALLYHIQQNYQFGWPYNYITRFYSPLYEIFGLNSQLYFALGVFTFFLASLGVYFFIKILTKNKLIAIASSLIFATGYIGIDQFTMMSVSLVNNVSIINICLVLIFYLLWLDRKKIQFYIIAILLFLFGITIFPYRTFPLILFIPTLGVIFSLEFKSSAATFIKKFIIFLLQVAPFLILPFFSGIYSYGEKSTVGVIQDYSIKNNAIYNILDVDFVVELFAILGRIIFITPISSIFGVVPDQNLFSIIGFIFFILMLLTSFFFFSGKHSRYARSLFAVLLLTMEGYIGNMVLLVSFDSNGPVNRYLTITSIFYSALLSLFLFLFLEKIEKLKWINKKLIFVISVTLVVLTFASLSREYEYNIIENRSKPAKFFFKDLKAYIPTLSSNNYYIFYFDNAIYDLIPNRFGHVLSSAFMGNNVNIAVPYNVSIGSVTIATSFDDFLYLIKNPPADKKVYYYTFYYDEKGLRNTTDAVFNLLERKNVSQIPKEQISYNKNHGSVYINVKTKGVSSLTPLNIRFSLKSTPYNSSYFGFPHIGLPIANKDQEKSVKNFYHVRNIDKSEIFSYLFARKKYYQTVKVEVDSERIDQQHSGSSLVDGRGDTYWLSDEGKNQLRWIKIDLGEERKIGGILWKNLPDRIPTKYEILTSLDGKLWKTSTNVRRSQVGSDKNHVVNNFDPENSRYVKVIIRETKNDFNPGFFEVEVIDESYIDTDLEAALRIFDNPFEYIKNEKELEMTYGYLKEDARLKISTLTNKDGISPNNRYDNVPIFLDGIYHEYEFKIPQGGTMLEEIRLEANFPASFNVNRVLIENQSKESVLDGIRKKCLEFTGVEEWKNPFDCS